MTRPSPLAFGLLALTLASSPRAWADEPKAKDAHAPAPASTKHDATPATPAPITGHESAPTTAHANPAAGHGAAEAHGQPNILAIEAPLAIWTVVVFGVLLIILAKFAWKPMMKALHDREEHVEHCLLEAERARNEAERLMAENQKNLAKAAEQMRAMIESGKKEGEAIAASIVQKAQAEAEAARERAERDIATARDQALEEIFTKTADLAVAVAGKVLSRDLTDADQKRLADAAMAELPAMANGRGSRS
jgi:F-type H+-transporting ATPase subunit b